MNTNSTTIGGSDDNSTVTYESETTLAITESVPGNLSITTTTAATAKDSRNLDIELSIYGGLGLVAGTLVLMTVIVVCTAVILSRKKEKPLKSPQPRSSIVFQNFLARGTKSISQDPSGGGDGPCVPDNASMIVEHGEIAQDARHLSESSAWPELPSSAVMEANRMNPAMSRGNPVTVENSHYVSIELNNENQGDRSSRKSTSSPPDFDPLYDTMVDEEESGPLGSRKSNLSGSNESSTQAVSEINHPGHTRKTREMSSNPVVRHKHQYENVDTIGRRKSTPSIGTPELLGLISPSSDTDLIPLEAEMKEIEDKECIPNAGSTCPGLGEPATCDFDSSPKLPFQSPDICFLTPECHKSVAVPLVSRGEDGQDKVEAMRQCKRMGSTEKSTRSQPGDTYTQVIPKALRKGQIVSAMNNNLENAPQHAAFTVGNPDGEEENTLV